jgi:HPt (histidine-containing phosphotransfer) domain-containing protein
MTEKPEKNIVRVDRELQDLIPGYLENRQHDIAAITQALEIEDFALIQSLGHSMKGSGGGYGFDAITGIGLLIEEAAKARDRAKVQTQVAALEEYLASLEIIYE